MSYAQLGLIQDGSLLIEGGRIQEVGTTRRIENLRKARSARLIDVSGKVVTPGLVDSHMRLAAGPPALEAFERRIAGLPASAPPERSARPRSSDERAKRWLRLAIASGATTVEVHSGWGQSPLRELRALRALAPQPGSPIGSILAFSTALPPERRDQAGLRQQAFERIEQVLTRGAVAPRAATVFHLDFGDGRFDEELARQSLLLARRLGYRIKASAAAGGASAGLKLALELETPAVEGLEGAAESDIDLLASSSTMATLLPNAASHLGSRFPPARRLLDRGAAVSLASGFSPDRQPGFGLQMAMAAACRQMALMPEEAIACCTINAAAAVGRADTIGSLEPNKQADLAVFDVTDYREIPYFFGVDLCWMTMKNGRIVYIAERTERE